MSDRTLHIHYTDLLLRPHWVMKGKVANKWKVNSAYEIGFILSFLTEKNLEELGMLIEDNVYEQRWQH